MLNLWRALEAIPGLVAVRAVWRAQAGADFPATQAAWLRPTGRPAQSYPCGCGCSHRIVRHSAERIVAICQCDPWNCDDIPLPPEEAILWEFSHARLGRAICRALEIDALQSDADADGTSQIGAFSAKALAVYLTIAHGGYQFHHTVAELAAKQSEGFILFAPTSQFLDGASRELLVKARAGFFDLESNFTLLPSGLLHARARAGELFAPFTSPSSVIIEETARKAFAIVQALDTQKPHRDASLLTVFRLYCVEGLSAEAAAQRCGCSKATILNRLSQMEQRIGTSPANLRTYSAQFQAIEDSLSDPRARRIRRQSARDGLEADEEERSF